MLKARGYVGAVLVTALVVAGLPAQGHNGSARHNWNHHYQAFADARYVQPATLTGGDGTINQATDPVDWTRLKSVPQAVVDQHASDLTCTGCVANDELARPITADDVSCTGCVSSSEIAPSTSFGVYAGRALHLDAVPPGTVFGHVMGETNMHATESRVQTISPATPLVARDLAARLSADALGPTDELTLTLRVNGVDTPLTCAMTGTNSCTFTGASAAIPAASLLSLGVTTNFALSPPSRALMFSFRVLS